MLINYTTKELDMMARLMRAEALAEGNLGMLMVGNVIVNRAIATCYTFKDVRTISAVVNQSPGGFSGVNSSLFIGSATTKEKQLAERNLKGEYYYPATNALWFYAPGAATCKTSWFEQPFSGSYKKHCFYRPTKRHL